MTQPNYQRGDRVQIIADRTFHRFSIGQIVTIKQIMTDAPDGHPYYRAMHGSHVSFVDPDEIEPIGTRTPPSAMPVTPATTTTQKEAA